MLFTETNLKGAYIIDVEKRQDHRGFFSRTWCMNEFELHGLSPAIVQINTTFSPRKGTLRGLHYQIAPHQEVKVVRCTKGALFDVMVDLRPNSPTHKQWFGIELNEENHRMLYIPRGFAHGSLTLTDNTELCYQATEFYYPKAARGVRFDDHQFAIEWPIPIEVISDADKNWPVYLPSETLEEETIR